MTTLLAPLFLAAAVPFPWDSTFDDLTFVESAETPNCRAEFQQGRIGFTTAFNEKREGHPVLLITGKPSRRLRIGQRLYAKGQATIYHNALVIAATEQSATLVVGQALIGHILADQAASIVLMETPADINRAAQNLLSFADDDMTGLTVKIATALDCSFAEGV